MVMLNLTKKWIFEFYTKFGFRSNLQTFWPRGMVKSELSLGLSVLPKGPLAASYNSIQAWRVNLEHTKDTFSETFGYIRIRVLTLVPN